MGRLLLKVCIFYLLGISTLLATEESSIDRVTEQATRILHRLSVKEKIGQKLMLDFRYWCEDKTETQNCKNDFVEINATVKQIILDYHIGGIILFSNNLKNITQITTLTDAFQKTMLSGQKLPLFISTDQEGGIVARLPRDITVTFGGNMATAAAYLGLAQTTDIIEMGKMLATHLKAVGININLAPAVDVNINPLNPVIHVRSFSDDPHIVGELGKTLSQAMQNESIGTAIKHFPGHGDTTVDSHIGLPTVNHTLQEAEQIDLAPFKAIIDVAPPDLIMIAHIQFPALDNTKVYAGRIHQEITTPATLSRRIQYDLLRNKLHFHGLIITDALNMGAIAENFDPFDATLKAFLAGSDIALMPIQITNKNDVHHLDALITKLEATILDDHLAMQNLDQSVLNILKLKIKLGLMQPDPTPLSEKIKRAKTLLSDRKARDLEANLSDRAITLVKNHNHLLPFKSSNPVHIHILMPWLEQGAGITEEVHRLQAAGKVSKTIYISYAKMSETDLEKEKQAVDGSELIIVGNITNKSIPLFKDDQKNTFQKESSHQSLVFPEIPTGDTALKDYRLTAHMGNVGSDALLAYQVLQYAKHRGKNTIFISLLAPYDLPNYASVSDAMLASYNFYGYIHENGKSYYRGPSMPALTRLIFGLVSPQGKLPVNIPDPNDPQKIIFPRGSGITKNHELTPKS